MEHKNKKRVEYITVFEKPPVHQDGDFITRVNDKLCEGWRLWGATTFLILPDGQTAAYQPMIRRVKDE